MEMEHHEMEAIAKRRHEILDRVTLMEKGIKILDLEWFMWTQMKQNYDKHVKQIENWKDTIAEEKWAYSIVSNGVGSIDAWCNVGISKHILDQGCKYLLWA